MIGPDFDQYEVLQLIGAGAQSNVYKVAHRDTRKRFAIKHVVLNSPDDQRFFRQLENEYRMAKDLDHPNIAKVYDLVVRKRRMRVAEAYLVMELVRGKPMEPNRRAYAFEQLMFYFRQAADALDYIHALGILHTDVKPKNLLITKRDLVKLVDFGQATVPGRRKGRVQGTFDFMAPEQVTDGVLDARTDVYNLAATMYFMLSGRIPPPLVSATVGDLDYFPGRSRRPPTIQDANPQVSAALDELLRQSLSRVPGDRPPTMADFITRLDAAI